jgi:hypothetical protein
LRGAIVGCGLIGHKRAAALRDCAITVCCDVREDRAEALAAKFPRSCSTTDWRAAVGRDDVDFVVVATTHDMLAPVAAAAAAAGKHVLVENRARDARGIGPGGRGRPPPRRAGPRGFNHRYIGLFAKPEIFESGALGQMMFIRGRYGGGAGLR